MRVSFKTFGCRLNQYDTEWLREEFKLAGFECVDARKSNDICKNNEKNNADVCVVNTCTVTARPCKEARKLIRSWARRTPKPFIIATGCYAKINPEEILQVNGIDLVESDPKKIVTNFLKVPLLSGIKSFSGRDKAFLKVQEGCDQFCSYCIVPYARGKPRERPLKEILQEVENLIQNGYREFILTGTNLGKCKDLLRIVKSIESFPEVRRLGLGSIEPIGISDKLLEFIGNSSKCSKYFHIPLQSGDNKILKSMGRWYTREEYETLLHRIREKVPDSAIGADVIVGFFGEGDAEFLNTYNLIANSPISRLHIFKYSQRPMTQAINFENEPESMVKRERSHVLIKLGEKKWVEFRSQFIGKTLEAHIESSSQDEWRVGVTSNYIKILFEPQKNCDKYDSMNSGFINLRIVKIDGARTYGKVA